MVIVDAANVIGARPDGWWRDRAGANARLVARLRQAGLVGVVVVVEGAARAGVPAGGDPVRVVHARGSGDDAIVSLVEEARGDGERIDVTVVTADRELRARVSALGAQVVGPRWLYDQLAEDGPQR